MSTTTKKSKLFVESPCGQKAVTEIPGIGLAATKYFKMYNLTLARELIGLYLFKDNNDQWLENFLKEKIHMSRNNIIQTLNAVKTWVSNFVSFDDFTSRMLGFYLFGIFFDQDYKLFVKEHVKKYLENSLMTEEEFTNKITTFAKYFV
jgi:hypothetical protein